MNKYEKNDYLFFSHLAQTHKNFWLKTRDTYNFYMYKHYVELSHSILSN